MRRYHMRCLSIYLAVYSEPRLWLMSCRLLVVIPCIYLAFTMDSDASWPWGLRRAVAQETKSFLHRW